MRRMLIVVRWRLMLVWSTGGGATEGGYIF